MKKRFWGIYALAFIQLVFQPALNLFVLLAFGTTPGPVATAELFGLPALMGGAVLAVQPWSFPVVVASSFLMFFRDIAILSGLGAPLWLAAIPLLVNIILSAYLLLPVLGSCRLDPRFSWFFSLPSYRVGLPARVEFESGESLFFEIPVLSMSGAFLEGNVSADCPELAPGARATLHTRIPTLEGLQEIAIPIDIAFARWRSPSGISYGTRFLELGKDSNQVLGQLAQVLLGLGNEARYESDSSEEFHYWFWTQARGLWIALAKDLAPVMLPMPGLPPAYSGKPELRLLSAAPASGSEPALASDAREEEGEREKDSDTEPAIPSKRVV